MTGVTYIGDGKRDDKHKQFMGSLRSPLLDSMTEHKEKPTIDGRSHPSSGNVENPNNRGSIGEALKADFNSFLAKRVRKGAR